MKTLRVVPLADVRDIEIEHKTSHRLAVERPGLPLPQNDLGSEAEHGRLVVLIERAEPIRFVDLYGPGFEATERLAKARTFLRSHAWKPLRERDEPRWPPR